MPGRLEGYIIFFMCIVCWFGHVQRTEENGIPKRVLYMNLETTRLRGRPRNIWQDEVAGWKNSWWIKGAG
jgi:hypothetical protein